MHKEMEAKMEELKEMKKTLVDALKAELAKGVYGVETKEAGEVVDMIKDLAETEKLCYEACYYKTVIEAMDEAGEDGEEDGYMGYNRSRAANGRYTSSRRRGGGRMGYKPYLDQEPYIRQYLKDPYRFEDDMRMGYTETRTPERGWEHMTDRDTRYGKAFNEYKNARKHYTTTNSEVDKNEMRAHANEHVMDTMVTIREIWDGADPELRKQMKGDFMKLIDEMKV